MRATRDLLRRRTGVVRHCASLKAHVVNTDSQYNLPAQSLNLKNISARESLRHHYDDEVVQRTIELDMVLLDCYAKELAKVECFIEKQAKQHHGAYLYITRFKSVQNFASYSRLVKCKAESAGKTYGTSGNKIGNGHLKWAFSEAAVLYLRGNEKAKNHLNKLQRRMSKGKVLSALAHKIGRCIYFMLRDKAVFDEKNFLKG